MKSEDDQPPSLRQRFRAWLQPAANAEPESRDDIVQVIESARNRNIVDIETSDTLQRVLQVSDLRVRDVMVPRSQMKVMSRDGEIGDFIAEVVNSRHSRYPVIDGDRDKVVGILLAKDLLSFNVKGEQNFYLRDIMRPVVFIPESKRLNVLLNEFRASRNHMAVVVDEYGGVAGLVTIEDVLEQIVGNIQDEHDIEDNAVMIVQQGEDDYVVKALCPLDEFNAHFGTQFDEDEYDTVGGLVMAQMGRVPRREETVETDAFTFEVLHADSRRLHLLRVRPSSAAPAEISNIASAR